MRARRQVSHRVMASVLCALLLISTGVLAVDSPQRRSNSASVQERFGTWTRPFSAGSYWNATPLNPVLGQATIPDSDYYPQVGEGPYSSSVFLASKTDKPQEVFGLPGKPGLWELDGEQHLPSITIPRWPAGTVPASGSDGHADIVDPVDGIVHSFFQLRKDTDGRWIAGMYAWSSINGRGWGDPAHYYQGARATAVPPLAGLIRKHEVDDGREEYDHALSLSLTYNALSSDVDYMYPATSADREWRKNSGQIPEGSLLMLPADFDVQQITSPGLRKVVNTLKRRGAYVVDRNVGTPFYIYVENGSGFNLHGPKWNNQVAKELRMVQRALRPVVAVSGWLDGHGKPMNTSDNLNLLSMRGPWQLTQGTGEVRYDTHSQSVWVKPGSVDAVYIQRNGRGINSVKWGSIKPGVSYRVQLEASPGLQFRLRVQAGPAGKDNVDTPWMNAGESFDYRWPEGKGRMQLFVRVKPGEAGAALDREGAVRATLTSLEEPMMHPLLGNDSVVMSR